MSKKPEKERFFEYSISSERVIKKISKFTRKSFSTGTKNCQKIEKIKNKNYSNCPIWHGMPHI